MTDERAVDSEAIGQRLRLARDAYGFAQGEFAEAAGLTQHAYNQYENGKRVPSIDVAIALRDRHRLTLDYIYCGDLSGLRFALGDTIRKMQELRQRRA